ncbi:MAG: hypothetical protein HC809_10100 [Gammaproteobacteria bacterium]|nr:hypothetical protein [Gammaproteobacteria bacterium]
MPTIGHVILRTAIISSVESRKQARAMAILMFRPPVRSIDFDAPICNACTHD